jgi:hypothetical protein
MYVQSPPRSTQSDYRHPRNRHEAEVAYLRGTPDEVVMITAPGVDTELGDNFHFAYHNGLGLNVDTETIQYYLEHDLKGITGNPLPALAHVIAHEYYDQGTGSLSGVSFWDWLTSNEYSYFIFLDSGALRSVRVWAHEEQSEVSYGGRWYTAFPAVTSAYQMIIHQGDECYGYLFRITTRDGGVYAEGDHHNFNAKLWSTPENLSSRERFHMACLLMLDDPNLVNSEGRRRRELDPNWLRHLH